MESTDNIGHPAFVADLLGVGNDIADSGMGTPRDDDQALLGLVHQGGIIHDPVRYALPLFPSKGHPAFKGVVPGDLPQKNQSGSYLYRGSAQLKVQVSGHLFPGYQGAEFRNRVHTGTGENVRVGHQGRALVGKLLNSLFRQIPDKRFQAPGMVQVAVGDHQKIKLGQVFVHFCGIAQKKI